MAKRGRPPKRTLNIIYADWMTPEQPPLPMNDTSLYALIHLSEKIASILQTKRDAFTDALTEAAAYYPTTLEIRHRAPLLVKRRGNRPNIHLATLLHDCALALQKHKGMDAQRELEHIGEWTEGASEVIKCAKAVLTALGINHPQSLRQQAKQAAAMLLAARK
jgi:hypothetical protein